MRVIAAKLYSDQGVPLPRHREISLRYRAVGLLSMEERYEKDFRRMVRVANLRGSGENGLVFPTLYDAAIVWIGDGELRVRGFEINPISQAHVAMAWAAEILEDQRPSRLLVSPDGAGASSVITCQADLESAFPGRISSPPRS